MSGVLAGTERGLVDVGSGDTLLGGEVTALAGDARGWWAIVDGHRIARSAGGRTWEDATTLRGLTGTCALPSGDRALVGTSEAHLVTVDRDSTSRVRSFERVATRDTWYTPWGGPPDTRSLSSGGDGRAYANVHVGGILASDDAEHWRPTTMDVDADVHQVLAHPERGGVAFAATAIGMATTLDGGETWEFTEEGLHATYCRAVALAGETLLLSASTSHTGRKSALYRRPPGVSAFERCTEGLPEWFADNVDTYCLDAAGDRAALGTSDGLVFTSDDAGRTWERAASGLAVVRCVALVG